MVSATTLQHPSNLPLGFPVLDVPTLITVTLRFPQTEEEFHPAPLEIEAQGHNIETVALDRLLEAGQFPAMQQEFTATIGHMIMVSAPRLPWFDPGADKKEFITNEETVTFRKRDLCFPH